MLVPILSEHGYELNIKYASADNLAGRLLYTRPVALLLPAALSRLDKARDMAAALGLGLMIYDAFRPLETQWALWEAVTDKRFVADPRDGGVHPRGGAVDLTLTDGRGGAELDMGTAFDEVAPASAHGSLSIGREAQRNRALLLGIMTGAGWDFYGVEWWHYQLFDVRTYPALWAADVPDGPI